VHHLHQVAIQEFGEFVDYRGRVTLHSAAPACIPFALAHISSILDDISKRDLVCAKHEFKNLVWKLSEQISVAIRLAKSS
jgi:hypothetical protein